MRIEVSWPAAQQCKSHMSACQQRVAGYLHFRYKLAEALVAHEVIRTVEPEAGIDEQ